MADDNFVPDWEQGCCNRTHNAWLMLRGAFNARDLGAKLVYIEQMIKQLESWRDLLTMGKTCRTFEVICRELAEKPCMSDWKVRFMDCGAHYADFECDYLNPLLIYTNGEVWWTRDERQAHLSAEQLAAISAACSEIAAAYEASEGKEDA